MSTAPTELIIEAGHTERNYWRDLFRYRELFYFLAWRDVLVRYKQTVIGILWAVLRPLLTMIVFTFVFSRIAKLPSGGIPYPVLVFAAMLPWQLFATSLSEGSGSLINNANLISKVYFPAAHRPSQRGHRLVRRFCDLRGAARHHYGDLSGLARLAAPDAAGFHPPRTARLRRGRHLAGGFKCKIPRLSLRRAVHRPVWALHFSGWLAARSCRQNGVCSMISTRGWGHRRLPLGDLQWPEPVSAAEPCPVATYDWTSPRHWNLVFPENGTDLRGCDLRARPAVRVLPCRTSAPSIARTKDDSRLHLIIS
jgi:hypothetical protein